MHASFHAPLPRARNVLVIRRYLPTAGYLGLRKNRPTNGWKLEVFLSLHLERTCYLRIWIYFALFEALPRTLDRLKVPGRVERTRRHDLLIYINVEKVVLWVQNNDNETEYTSAV